MFNRELIGYSRSAVRAGSALLGVNLHDISEAVVAFLTQGLMIGNRLFDPEERLFLSLNELHASAAPLLLLLPRLLLILGMIPR